MSPAEDSALRREAAADFREREASMSSYDECMASSVAPWHASFSHARAALDPSFRRTAGGFRLSTKT